MHAHLQQTFHLLQVVALLQGKISIWQLQQEVPRAVAEQQMMFGINSLFLAVQHQLLFLLQWIQETRLQAPTLT